MFKRVLLCYDGSTAGRRALRRDVSLAVRAPTREVLPDVESLEVQAVGADFDEQRIDEHLGETRAAIVDQRITEGGEIGEDLGGAGVGLERGVCWNRNGGLGAGSEAHHDAGDEQSNGLVWEALAKSGVVVKADRGYKLPDGDGASAAKATPASDAGGKS